MCRRGKKRRSSNTCMDSSISSCSGTPPTNTSAHESSAGPRRRVFEDVEAHVLCGPPLPRGEKLTNTHSIQGGRNHSPIARSIGNVLHRRSSGGRSTNATTTTTATHTRHWPRPILDIFGPRGPTDGGTHSHSDRK